MRKPQLIAVVLSVVVCLLVPIRLHSQTVDCSVHWDLPFQISHDSLFNTVPRIAVAAETLHLIWFGMDFFGATASDGVQYSRSTDGGTSFSPPLTLASFDSALNPAYITSSEGVVYVAYEVAADTFSGIMLSRSPDGGTTWEPAVRLRNAAYPVLIEAAGRNVYLHFYYQGIQSVLYGMFRSSDYGVTWSLVTSDMPGLSSLIATGNQLYAVAALGSGVKDVYYMVSDTLGAVWHIREVLSNEFDFTTSLSPQIAGNGKRELYAVWNDTGSVYFRRSVNAGGSWLPAEKISTRDGAVFPSLAAGHEFVTVVWDNDFTGPQSIQLAPSNDYGRTFCPADYPATDSGGTGPSLRISGNDVHLVWADQEDIRGSIFYRHGTLIDNPNVAEHPPADYVLSQNFPNPFNENTRIRYELPAPAHVVISLYDILGRRVATLVDEEKGTGRYEVVLSDLSIASGMYIYQLRAGEYVMRKKLLLLR